MLLQKFFNRYKTSNLGAIWPRSFFSQPTTPGMAVRGWPGPLRVRMMLWPASARPSWLIGSLGWMFDLENELPTRWRIVTCHLYQILLFSRNQVCESTSGQFFEILFLHKKTFQLLLRYVGKNSKTKINTEWKHQSFLCEYSEAENLTLLEELRTGGSQGNDQVTSRPS